MSQSTGMSSRRQSNLSLDLTDLPPLSQPSPPSNTLLVTNLQDPAIFTTPVLSHVQQLISQHSPSGIHSFCPLTSMRRIIISFPSIEAAVQIKSVLDGQEFFNSRVRVYFGSHTAIEPPADVHLTAPKLDKQFFISPPPSPPAGWEVKEEDPPNKEVHAEDLASALERLSARSRQQAEDHGHNPHLPAIAVEDTTNFTTTTRIIFVNSAIRSTDGQLIWLSTQNATEAGLPFRLPSDACRRKVYLDTWSSLPQDPKFVSNALICPVAGSGREDLTRRL